MVERHAQGTQARIRTAAGFQLIQAVADSVLIVGASVAGVGAANELRRCGFSGSIALVDTQSHLPYDRPPLSKAALQDQATNVHFHDREHYDQASIDLYLGTAAAQLVPDQREVLLQSGDRLKADAIIIATGARARLFPRDRCNGGIHFIRDLDDALRLRALLKPGKRLAVVGGGFIGSEVASTAIRLGLQVTLIEAADVPFARIVGTRIAARIADLHRDAGIDLQCGVGVKRIETSVAGQRLVLGDGRSIEADIVVAGLGSLPNLEWLEGSGLKLDNGIVCDERGSTGVPGIYAAGDVASWMNPWTGVFERHEHWTAAREQARIVVQSIAGQADSAWEDFLPYFWSDMHGVRIQLLGSASGADDVQIVHEDRENKAFLAEYHKAGHLIGVVGANAGARTMRYGMKITRPRRLITGTDPNW
jgi:3-phenylpropionate/trans-cinnamate dioxygenase ferredoxin reductase subunit